jgi:hypothetical protein
MDQPDTEAINRLSKQIRTVKIMLGVFLVMILANLVTLAFIAITVVAFTRTVTDKVTNIQHTTQQNLDFKSKICDNATLQSFLGSGNDLCKPEQ